MYGVVIPNRFPDIITPLIQSIHEKIPLPPPIIIIMDGHNNDYGFKGIPYDDPHFAFARAVNIGIRALPDKDIVLTNDDCRILEWNFFNRLRELAYADPLCGILSPLIVGCVGNAVQRWHERDRHWTPEVDFINVAAPSPVCFPCVYLKRRMLDHIGLMNERIAGYGYDDHDLSSRARRGGWKTMVTQRVIIQHADGSAALGEGRGKSWASSFMKRWPGRGTPTTTEIEDYLKRNKL
jgi:GT2 family glycosyltransferase